ncbi:MAG: tol-pal system protein YbgF [Geobacteraceae bacterium]|nr:tol-pal system protein YbgF [Geobacteraceae bacterium]
MRLINAGLSLFFLVALAGCASKSDLDYLRFDVEELKTRFPKVEKELGTLRNETKAGLEKNLKGLQTDMETIRRGAADLQANIEAMKVDMQVVAGKLDDAAIAAKKPADELALLREDMVRRLAAVEERLAKLAKELEEQKKAAVAETEKNPETLYQKGLETFRSGDHQKARELLTKFIGLYPAHELVANAHYWLGETYYSEKKYEQAVLEFQEVIKNFPGKEKVAAAMLKQAMAFRELGDVKSARYLFKKLVDDFPAADEAKSARERLKELK